MSDAASNIVRRRRVFYIPGYDPFHPRRYRELYRKEGAEQAEISGYSLTLRPRKPPNTPKGGGFGWAVDAQIGGARVDTTFEVLIWSDLVRGSMSNTIAATYGQLIRTAWEYIATGALRRLMLLRKGPVIAALYPVGALILMALVAVLAGHLVARLALWLTGATGWFAWAIWAVLALPMAYAVLRWFQARDNRTFVYYLMHDYAYAARDRGAYPPELAARLAEFRTRIAAAMAEDVDEVLVVGHSSGAHLAVSVLADLIRDGVPGRPALGFLSLGQVVPMVSFLRDAWRLRADLAYLSTRSELTWIDVTAPGDGCSFALCDPVSVSGVEGPGKRWPLVISAAFTQTLTPERWQSLRWRFFRLHFQYLCAFDRPGDYDYFQITAGPQTLAARYAGRQPSKSRIDVTASRYTHIRP